MILFVEVQWWRISAFNARFIVRFELRGGRKITHLTSPIVNPPIPLFSYACYKTHPRFLEWTTVHTRYLSLGDNVKIPEARASFFQMEFRQASLIYEPTWTHQVTIKHSMSRLNSNGRDSTWQTTMIESINAFVLSDLYRKKINALCPKKN